MCYILSSLNLLQFCVLLFPIRKELKLKNLKLVAFVLNGLADHQGGRVTGSTTKPVLIINNTKASQSLLPKQKEKNYSEYCNENE